jgi:cell division protease FtsH
MRRIRLVEPGVRSCGLAQVTECGTVGILMRESSFSSLFTALNRFTREHRLWSGIIAAGLVAGLVTLAALVASPSPRSETFTEQEFMAALAAGELADIEVHPSTHRVSGEGVDSEGEFNFVYRFLDSADEDLLAALRTHAPDYEVAPTESAGPAASIVPLMIIGGIVALVVIGLRRRPQMVQRKRPVDTPSFGFDRLGGLDEAIVEVSEVVEFLSDPARFTRLGAKPPRGVLLEGPPGTGKTALARAAAGEAEVPFFAASASEFVEMFVGVGAKRVRELFKAAASAAPAVIFIDEIDAIGRTRGVASANNNDERESTLNQLLTEMDGFFQDSAPVVVMAATNRSDVLDSALMRRFPRHIHIGLPDRTGRARILGIHLESVTTEAEVDITSLAARTVGFSGSDLERLVNEAAVFAARNGSAALEETHLESAFDRIVLGLERRSAVVSPRDREIVAYHEAGHTLCAYLQPAADRPHKVSIVPRGFAGGVSHFTPSETAFMTRNRALASLRAMMGGRAAEALLLGEDITSGAAHDLASASKLARQMVTNYGMGSVGPIFVGSDTPISPDTARAIETDVTRLIDEALGDAHEMVTEHRATLERLVEALQEEETLDSERIVEVLERAHSPV